MIEAETPSLWEIRLKLGHPAAVAILVNAFIHAAKLVNLEKNLTQEQIGEAANDILETYGYLKVEELKYLLKRALRTQNVYGRLDYNVLMNWVEQYDAERTDEAMRASEQEDMQRLNATPAAEGAISLAEYMERLKQRADTDEEAARKLGVFTEMASQPAIRTKEEQTEKDNEFRKFKIDYIIRQNVQRRNNGENL